MLSMTIDWGDAPTWVGAITTLGAFVAARRILQVELQRDQVAADDRARTEQAAFCAAWPDFQGGHGRVIFHNGSQLPVYDLVVNLRRETGEVLKLGRERIQPPGEKTYGWPMQIYKFDDGGNLERDERDLWVPECDFTDTAGRRWFRGADGVLGRAMPSHLGAVRGP